MTTKSSFLPRLSLSRNDNSSVLPFHNTTSRYSNLRSKPSEYDLDDLSPHPDDGLLSPDFNTPNSPPLPASVKPSNRKPTGALNRRPSNSSSGGSTSKIRRFTQPHEPVLFAGPPPPIAVSRVFYRDEEQRYTSSSRYDDYEDADAGPTASWLPGTARRAISSVMWDRPEAQDLGDAKQAVYDKNSVWRGLARRERGIVRDLQQFLQAQEESLSGGRTASEGGERSPSVSDGGSATPTGTATGSVASSSRNPRRSVSFLEPVTRSGPGGEIIPVRQPRQKKIGISGARKGIARSMLQLTDLKAEEEASLLAALSTRKQALNKLRKLATRRDGIVEELKVLETDGKEPLAKELEELGSEHNDVCSEILELEERLAGLKSRRRYLEGKMDDVKNRREAGLSGYKNALREVEDTVKGFLTRPPVKPLDVEALAENMKEGEQPLSPGGVEFMHLRPERRTVDMARDWWDSEVIILEKRKAEVDTERAALEEGREMWEEVVGLVLDFEADLRRQMMTASTTDIKGKERELADSEILKLQYEKINSVVVGLEQRLGVAEDNGWNLLIAAIGAELEAFREAKRMSRSMLQAAGVDMEDDSLSVPPRYASREDSGTTGTNNSFHTVDGGSINLPEQLLDLPNNHEDEVTESDNEVPHDLLATAEEKPNNDDEHVEETSEETTDTGIALFDREDSENEVPPEFLVEHHDTRN